MATSASALSGSFSVHRTITTPPQAKTGAPQIRRTNPEQGRALETLGHAIEYLIDSRMFEDTDATDQREAVHTLMCASRAVFDSCQVVVSLRQRMRRGILRRLHLQSR